MDFWVDRFRSCPMRAILHHRVLFAAYRPKLFTLSLPNSTLTGAPYYNTHIPGRAIQRKTRSRRVYDLVCDLITAFASIDNFSTRAPPWPHVHQAVPMAAVATSTPATIVRPIAPIMPCFQLGDSYGNKLGAAADDVDNTI